MTKVVKIQLISKNDDSISFKDLNSLLWRIQKETRSASNAIIRYLWEDTVKRNEWKETHGEYPTKDEAKTLTNGQSLSGYIYNKVKGLAPSMNTGNLSVLNQKVSGRYKALTKEILRGDVSIPSYKKNMPIQLHKDSIKLSYEPDENGGVKEWVFALSLLSTAARKEFNLPKGGLFFKGVVPAKNAGSVRTILERCYDEVYRISSSELMYDNGKWFLMLCFSFDKSLNQLDEKEFKNIMGVHIGENNAVVCSFSNKNRVMTIDGGEVQAFAAQIERRKRSIGMATSKHSVLVGGGRVGHGYKKKLQPLEHINDKISNFRKTTNHRYSRQIINWAIQNKCGVIQIEDLNGFASGNIERYTFLKNWSYYDLTEKIITKAKEAGIKVVKVSYKGLWKWCPNCNTLTVVPKTDEDVFSNEFVCTSCGEIINHDKSIPLALVKENVDEMLKSKDKESEEETADTE